jgi:Uma2 family endonuclease
MATRARTSERPEKQPTRKARRAGPSAAHSRRVSFDWRRWYLRDEDDVGNSPDQNDAIDDFTASALTRAHELGWTNVRVASDEFFAWVKKHPLVRVSPDTFVLDDPPPGQRPEMWETWRPGIRAPRFALEVVSDKSPRKDLVQGPEKYHQLGTRELVIFDQTVAEGKHPRSKRVPLEVWRRTPKGRFRRVYRGGAPAWSEELQAALVITFDITGAALLRLARDEQGTQLIPTTTEARAEAERQRAEAERQRVEAERRSTEAERRRAEAERRSTEAERQRAEAERQRAEAERQHLDEKVRREALERELAALRERLLAVERG